MEIEGPNGEAGSVGLASHGHQAAEDPAGAGPLLAAAWVACCSPIGAGHQVHLAGQKFANMSTLRGKMKEIIMSRKDGQELIAGSRGLRRRACLGMVVLPSKASCAVLLARWEGQSQARAGRGAAGLDDPPAALWSRRCLFAA